MAHSLLHLLENFYWRIFTLPENKLDRSAAGYGAHPAILEFRRALNLFCGDDDNNGAASRHPHVNAMHSRDDGGVLFRDDLIHFTSG
jgi:hypothetical protein